MRETVVVTGMGAVAPFALNAEQVFAHLCSGQSSIRLAPHISPLSPAFFGAWLDQATASTIDQKILSVLGQKYQASLSLAQKMAFFASYEACRQACILDASSELTAKNTRLGIFLSACRDEYSAEALFEIASAQDKTNAKISIDQIFQGVEAITAEHLWLKRFVCEQFSFLVERLIGLQAELCQTPVDACAAGAMAIGSAYDAIRFGHCDLAIAGGAGSLFQFLPTGLFQLLGALAPLKNDDAQKICCPFDQLHRGFVMGENGGVLVLESESHALARGAKILGRILGYAQTLEASRPTASLPDGSEVARCISAALHDANLAPSAIGHINTHGTSTLSNDMAEALGIKKIFHADLDKVCLSATKSMLGHSLMGSGAIEAVITLMCLQQQSIPPILNLANVTVEADGLLLQKQFSTYAHTHAISNSFGFGGENACLVFGLA